MDLSPPVVFISKCNTFLSLKVKNLARINVAKLLNLAKYNLTKPNIPYIGNGIYYSINKRICELYVGRVAQLV